MSIRRECDVPYAGESIPLGELATFLEQAQSAGADYDTPVVAVAAPRDDALVVALRIETEGPLVARAPAVRVDREDVAQLVAVLDAIEDNDGDARRQLNALHELRRRLTKPAIG